MDTQIKIERLTSFTPETLGEVRRLIPQIGKNYKELTDAAAQEMIESPHTYLFIARDTGTHAVLGMGTLFVHRIPYVKKASMEDIVVDEVARGRGVGTLLINVILDKAKEQGASFIDCTARPRREGSNTLYEKLGFEKRETNVYRKIFNYGEL